jgi:hypothetical protein
MNACRRVAALAVLTGMFGFGRSGEALAQRSGPTVPVLAQHQFVEPPMMRMPFVRSTVKLGIGAGRTGELDYGTVVLPQGDTLIALRGQLVVAELSFEYQYAVREWLGVYGEVTLKGRAGTDGPSLLQTGVTYGTAIEVGWLGQLWEGERSLLSGSFYLTKRDVALIDPFGFVADVVEGRSPQLVANTPSLRVGVASHYALALNRVVGLYATGTASYGESLLERETEWLLGITGGVSLDLGPKGLPVGLGVTARADDDASALGVAGGPWEALGLRITYTEPTDLQLSLVSRLSWVPFTERDDMKVAEIGVDMRYYFF